MRHTPKPIIDIGAAIPELAVLARETVRLHPRRGERPPDQSKMGGRFLWPADEPWPLCAEHQSPLVTVLQLTATDVPELGFPQGTDLFQLLWCPNDHQVLQSLYAPAPRVFWRKRDEIAECLKEPPPPRMAEDHYCPAACVVYPERVVEYPSAFEVADDLPELWQKIERFEASVKATIADPDAPDNFYQYWLSVADGTKVKGYPSWVQDPAPPQCSNCGGTMEYLLTVASAEFDGGTWGRWLAQEDRHVWGAPYAVRNAVQRAAGLMIEDLGSLNFFVCRACAGWPVAAVISG